MSKKILIVDDDLESLKLIGLMLQRRGYEIIVAQDGSQALEKAEIEDPELVILDVMMPGMDGYEVCRQLRASSTLAHLPVIMFTAKTLVGDKVAGFQAGADDYLTKPIHPAELVSHVEALLQRSEQALTAARRTPRARTIGVIGAKGGVGTSTLAVNLAVAAAQHKEGQADVMQVNVVELRTGLGSVALLLGHPLEEDVTALAAHNPDSLNRKTLESQIVSHSSGVHYLPAPLQPASSQGYLTAAHVDAMLNCMDANADFLFLDLGSLLDEATRHALMRCDVVVLVVEPEHLCLKLAKALLDELDAFDAPPSDVRVVSIERRAPGGAYAKAHIESMLGQKLDHIITYAPDIVRQAVEAGDPIVLLQHDSAIAQQLCELSRALIA
jgi:DNA-binding response OmpR family regulator